MRLLHIDHFDWTKLMRLYSVLDLHPMFNYHYASAVKKLDHVEKGYVKDAVTDYMYKFDPYANAQYERMYPILLILTGKTGKTYTGILDEMLSDRHDNELNMTYIMIKEQITELLKLCKLLAIETKQGSMFGREEHEVVHDVQRQYKKLFGRETENE